MAKVITTELQHSGASAANITLDSSKNVTCENNLTVDGTSTLSGNVAVTGNVTVTGTLPADKLTGALPAISGASLTGITSQDTLSNRNVLINGAMQINQRDTTGTLTGLGASSLATYFIDRWQIYTQNAGTARFTVSQDTESPDGFGHSLKVDCTTADASLDAAAEVLIQQKLEGYDLQRFEKGFSGAKTYTLSFWAKSDKTGTYICRLLGRDNTKSCVSKAYTIANTNWNKYTITFPADTDANRKDDSDNGESFRVVWWLIAGSTTNSGTLQETWANSTDTGAATGQVNFGDATNNFYLTGTQLEAGSTATEYEHRSYGDELARCQRYFWQLINKNNSSIAIASMYSASDAMWVNHHPVTMRSSPSIRSNINDNTDYLIGRWYNATGGKNGTGNLSVQRVNKNTILVYSAGWSLPATGAFSLESDNTSCYLGYEAEL